MFTSLSPTTSRCPKNHAGDQTKLFSQSPELIGQIVTKIRAKKFLPHSPLQSPDVQKIMRKNKLSYLVKVWTK